MEKNFAQTDEKIIRYTEKTFASEDSALNSVRKKMADADLPEIQVGRLDGLHLEVIARSCGAKKIVEIGTLGGYSGICLCRGMEEGGKLWTFELDEKHAEVARENFRDAGFEQTEVLVGPALDNLDKIKEEGPFDLVFIDADKLNYPNYYRWAEENLRVGGVLLGDNTFAFGHIGDETFESEDYKNLVTAMREFNDLAANSGSFRSTMLPTGEGLTFGVKVR